MTPEILNAVPWSAPMPALPQQILIAITGIVFLLSLWFVWSEHRRRRDWVPIFAFLGGGLAVAYEPLGDILTSVLYPVHGQIGWISLFGREIPLFIGVLYFWYMSVPALYFLKRLEQGLTLGQYWRLYLLSLIPVIGIEMFGVNMNAWIYYGPHPFRLFGVPLWATATYSGFVVMLCVGLQLMSARLDRRHHWLIIFSTPLFLIAGHCPLALPAAAAMFSTQNPTWIWLGGSLSIALTLLMVHAVGLAYCQLDRRTSATAAAVAPV